MTEEYDANRKIRRVGFDLVSSLVTTAWQIILLVTIVRTGHCQRGQEVLLEEKRVKEMKPVLLFKDVVQAVLAIKLSDSTMNDCCARAH